jgi:hypothetical protein
MSWFKRFGTYVLVFLLSGGWFALYQPWGAFLDPDGFTHAKIATLIWQRGFLQDFPWLDLTILHTAFVDQHLGLHLLELPFIQIWGMLPGAQIAGVVFAALAVTIFYAVAKWVGAQKPWLWTFLLATASPFIVRMSLAKSSPLAVACFLVGMAAFIKGRKRIAFLAGLIFSLVHGGWLLLLVSQGIVIGAMLGWDLLRALVGKIRTVSHIPRADWRGSLSVLMGTTVGCILGVLFHPNTRNFFRFLWVQVGVIGIQTPFERVRLGEEWRSITVGQLLVTIPLFILITAISLFLVRRSRTSETQEETIKAAKSLEARLFFPIVTIFLALLTLKSKRYGEYFIPTLALTGASFERALKLDLTTRRAAWKEAKRRTKISLGLIMILLVTSSAIDLKDTYVSLHHNILPFAHVDAPMKALSAVATPGERVFHPQWDLFPELFVANDRLRYISGMDPTYLFVASTTRSDVYADFVVDQATSTDAYAFIRENLGANYIIYERMRNVNFEKRLEQDSRFELLYEDTKFRVYRIQSTQTKKLSTG